MRWENTQPSLYEPMTTYRTGWKHPGEPASNRCCDEHRGSFGRICHHLAERPGRRKQYGGSRGPAPDGNWWAPIVSERNHASPIRFPVRSFRPAHHPRRYLRTDVSDRIGDAVSLHGSPQKENRHPDRPPGLPAAAVDHDSNTTLSMPCAIVISGTSRIDRSYRTTRNGVRVESATGTRRAMPGHAFPETIGTIESWDPARSYRSRPTSTPAALLSMGREAAARRSRIGTWTSYHVDTPARAGNSGGNGTIPRGITDR